MHNLPELAFKYAIILNLTDLLLKQRQLFPYIFIAMSLLGALPAIYFAGSHKRRTQGWDSQTVLGTFKYNLFYLSIAINFV